MAGTGAAVPSDAIIDLKENSQVFDRIVNSDSETVVGRVTDQYPSGKELLTIIGMNAAATTGNPAVGAAQAALDYKNEAQTYAEAAATNADWIYSSVADGEAVRVGGDYFWVVSATATEVLELWLMGATAATDTGKRTASKEYFEKFQFASNESYLSGKNFVKNALFEDDAIGFTGIPSGYEAVFETNTSGQIVESSTPFFVNRALESTHFYDGTNRSDYQIRLGVDIPESIQGQVGHKIRILFYIYVSDSRIRAAIPYAVSDDANGSYTSTLPLTTIKKDPVVGEWFPFVVETEIQTADCASIRFNCRLIASSSQGVFSGAIGRISGISCFFDDKHVSYDTNEDYEVRKIAQQESQSLSSNVTAIEQSVQQSEPWHLGQNKHENSLLLQDALGFTGTPTGFDGVAGSGQSIVEKNTPFGTNRALQVFHSYNGTTATSFQLTDRFPLAERLQGRTGVKIRYVYYANRESENILLNNYFCRLFDENGSLLGNIVPQKISTDGGANEWFKVVWEITINEPLTAEVQFNVRSDASTTTSFSANLWLTAFCVFFDDIHYDYDQNIIEEASEKTESLIASRSKRTEVTQYDQHVDSLGNAVPFLPNYTITAFGDSLTDYGYPAKVESLYTEETRTAENFGIGGETSDEILARIRGYVPNFNSANFTTGTVRLRAKRAVPERTFLGSYRSSWTKYGSRIAQPDFVQFENKDGVIGRSYEQLKAAVTFDGTTTVTAAGHPFADGDEVIFESDNLPAELYASKTYYILNVTTDTFEVAEVPYSSPTPVTISSGSATAVGDFYYDWEFDAATDNADIVTTTYTDKSANVQLLWMGVNNIPTATDAEPIKADIESAFNHAKTLSKRVVVMTLLNNETWAQSEFDIQDEVNLWISRRYKNNYVDVYQILLDNYDPSLQSDVDDFNAGIVPGSLRVDNIHLNDAGEQIVAKAVYDFLTERDW